MKKVLIIEDESDIREAVAKKLADHDLTIIESDNGEDGLATALQVQPDIILLDLKMPKMDGFDMLSRLREDEWGASVKVIVMSVLDDLNSFATASQNDFTEYIIKGSTDLEAVAERVKHHLTSE